MAKEGNFPAANVTRANEEDSPQNKLLPAANASFFGNQSNSRTSNRTDWEVCGLDPPNIHQANAGEGSSQSHQYRQSGVLNSTYNLFKN